MDCGVGDESEGGKGVEWVMSLKMGRVCQRVMSLKV